MQDDQTPQAEAVTSGTAMPEWLSRRDMPAGPWTVERGAPVRGQAYTDLANRKMVVPFGGDDASRVIRAHEMMHAKVSPGPIDPSQLDFAIGASDECIASAEEIRVNYLVKQAGFDVDLLRDGSEKMTGKRYASAGIVASWDAAVLFLAALTGTKGANDFIAGVRSVDPEFASMLTKTRAQIRKMHNRLNTSPRLLASTRPSHSGLPDGFIRYTIPMARFISGLLLNQSEGDQGADVGEMTEAIKARSSGSPTWARLVLDTSVFLSKHVDGRIGRKRIASATGRHPRHLERMLTDPERRIFDRRSRGKGGVILVDQSGSMHLNDSQIGEMVKAAPGCVIIGYSHRPGDTTGKPNVWIIANRGKVAESFPDGNGGNGVDGPALRFALTHRRTGEPFIWVCDGMVTDSNDHQHETLTEECAALAIKHRIYMAYNVDEAVQALHKAATSTLGLRLVGDIRYSRRGSAHMKEMERA